MWIRTLHNGHCIKYVHALVFISDLGKDCAIRNRPKPPVVGLWAGRLYIGNPTRIQKKI
jgi:hypothetical protein